MRDSNNGIDWENGSMRAGASDCYHCWTGGRRLWRAGSDRSTRMAWKGKFFGALIGLLVTRNVWGAVVGAMIGQMFDQGAVVTGAGHAAGVAQASISDV